MAPAEAPEKLARPPGWSPHWPLFAYPSLHNLAMQWSEHQSSPNGTYPNQIEIKGPPSVECGRFFTGLDFPVICEESII